MRSKKEMPVGSNLTNDHSINMPPTEPDDFAVLLSRRRHPWRRRLTTMTIVLVVLGLGGWIYARRGLSAIPAIQYTMAKVERGAITSTVTATGTLSALVTVQVGSQVSGRVEKIYADYNSHVKQGELIAQIDPSLFRANLVQANANLADAKASLGFARANLREAKATAVERQSEYARTVALARQGILSAQQLEQAKANAETAAAAVSAAQAQVTQADAQIQTRNAAVDYARQNLGYTNIYSPIDGTVISRKVDVGQTVQAAFQAPVLFTIAKDLRSMQIDTSVGESDVGKLRKGMRAIFTVDAYPGHQFSGVVRQIRNAAQTVQNIVTYDAVIDVANPDLKLKPGMTANVEFIVDQEKDVVRIPNGALLFHPDPKLLKELHVAAGSPANIPSQTSRTTVWVLHSGKPEPVSITSGITDGSVTQLVQGNIRPGEEVITDMSAKSKQGIGLF